MKRSRGLALAAFVSVCQLACGGGSASTANPDRSAVPLRGCAKAATVADFEATFISPTCGTGNGSCHGANQFKPNMVELPVYPKFLNQTPDLYCPSDKLINSAKPADSFLLVKINQDFPVCPGTTSKAGDRMPWHMDPLSAEDTACVEAYVQAVATGN